MICFLPLRHFTLASGAWAQADLAKPRLPRFFAELVGKLWPGKAWQTGPRPSFLGNVRNERLTFLGNFGQKTLASLANLKVLSQASLHFMAWKGYI